MQVFAATKFWSDDPGVLRKLIGLKKDAICLSTVSAESGECLDLVTDEFTQVRKRQFVRGWEFVTFFRILFCRG